MPEKTPSTSRQDECSRIVVPGQGLDGLRRIAPLIFPCHPDWERESAARLGSLEPALNTDEMVVITGRGNPKLAYEIGKILQFPIDYQPREIFASGESHVVLRDNNRKKETFIIQTTERGSMGTTVNDNIMDTFWMIDAARNASADKIRLVIPAFAYDRGDKGNEPREAIPAALLMHLFMLAGADSILTMDLHDRATEAASLKPVNTLFGSAALLRPIQRYLSEHRIDLNDVIIVSPDAGGGKRAIHYAGLLGLDDSHVLVIPKQHKPGANQIEHLDFDGTFDGKVAVIVDDKIDTSGTTISASDQLKQRGAVMVIAAATHGLASNKRWEERTNSKILRSSIDHVIITDTVVPYYDTLANPKVEIVSVAPVFANAIQRIHHGQSVSGLLPDPKHPENKDWICL